MIGPTMAMANSAGVRPEVGGDEGGASEVLLLVAVSLAAESWPGDASDVVVVSAPDPPFRSLL